LKNTSPEKKERSPMETWDAYISFLKKELGRRLDEKELSMVMQRYIRAIPVENVLEELKNE
jgi:hypothetical protein